VSWRCTLLHPRTPHTLYCNVEIDREGGGRGGKARGEQPDGNITLANTHPRTDLARRSSSGPNSPPLEVAFP